MFRVLLAQLLIEALANFVSIGSKLRSSDVGGVQHEVVDESDSIGLSKHVLIVDIFGPFRTSGDGVRSLGMIMDLKRKNCGATVDLLTGMDGDKDELAKATWGRAVHDKYLSSVRTWTPEEFRSGALRLEDYDRILIGGKLDILDSSGSGSIVFEVIDKLVKESIVDRSKVQIFWDEVPFLRCQYTAEKLCARVPGLVRRATKAAGRFYLLTVADMHRMQHDMNTLNMTRPTTVTTVWPMRFANMVEFGSAVRFAQAFVPGDHPSSRSVVLMSGNHHAVNSLMIKYLFNQGAISAICRSIRNYGSPVRLLFMGGLADGVRAAAASTSDTDCVDTNEGDIDSEEFRHKIQPNLRAWLNPFFEDVHSGVSVRNFAALLSGTPVVTSAFGMHGLSDEVFQCKGYPMPANASSPVDFVQFFIDNVVHNSGYIAFTKTVQSLSAKCVLAQGMTYPVVRGCRK